MKNLEVVKILNTIADILELQEVPFKPQAYRRAALSIESLSEDIREVYRRDELEEIPGVGKAIAEKITELLETGKLSYYEKLKKEIDLDIEELLSVPQLGPRKIKVLYKKLGIKNIKNLEKALEKHKIRALSGFGEKTEQILWEGVQFIKTKPRRFLYFQVQPVVEEIRKRLSSLDIVAKVEVAGSFRRGKETVGDLDFLVVSSKPQQVMNFFVSLPDVKEVLAKGTTKSSIRLSNGLQVDLRVVRAKEFGSAMNYFIGSKEHNVELRKFALSKGYTLSEYGLFTLKGKKWITGRTEQEIYTKLGLQYIPPELRENTGELTAALEGKLPKLIAVNDVKGVFHNHTVWSDGNNSLLEMAQKGEELGLKFISFNDHFGPLGIVHPLTEKRLDSYVREIEKVQKKVGIKVFSGLEIDILKDGTLPLSRKKLQELDVVIASVHLSTKMAEPEMTKRVCQAFENNTINILGHPTDRLLEERPEIALNWGKVFESARNNKVFLEINGSPKRMDLEGLKVKAALEAGCKFSLATDAHDLAHLPFYALALNMARRGWAETKDILNCWSLSKIEKALQK
ncbi:DNA polymerase/3'-5' exonuclease PolX [Candidatus Woesearchaeota archaeon]|nr:DNA polymerase/3'-5' exonuclease PolX [Candidatus Woesearchaeota archaeon]